MEQNIHTCPYCGSTEVFRFRCCSNETDSYDYERLNPDEAYVQPLAEQYNFLIDVGYCSCCKKTFDLAQTVRKETVITATDLEGRIANLRAAVKRKEEDRKYKCAAIRTNVAQSFDYEMARSGILFDELKAINAEISELKSQIEALEYILEQDATEVLVISEETQGDN